VKEARTRALDVEQDEDVRVALMGALQLHAPADVARETALACLSRPNRPNCASARPMRWAVWCGKTTSAIWRAS